MSRTRFHDAWNIIKRRTCLVAVQLDEIGPAFCLLRGLDMFIALLIEKCFRFAYHLMFIYEPPHGKTNNLHRRKQRRRSASQ